MHLSPQLAAETQRHRENPKWMFPLSLCVSVARSGGVALVFRGLR